MYVTTHSYHILRKLLLNKTDAHL